MDDVLERYLAEIRTDERMEAVTVFANQVKNLVAKFHVTEDEAFKILYIPDKYHKGIISVLHNAK